MELTTAANTNVTSAADAVKTPEPDTETPTRNQPAHFTNGIFKRRAPPLHLHHGHPVVVTYKECLKNHAAAMGGHAVDGCGEFMPSPSSNPTDPTSLKCAACGCHRNFHRRDPDVTAAHPPPPPSLEYHPHHRHLPPPPHSRGNDEDDDNPTSPNDSPSPPPISSTYPHMLLPLGGQQVHHHHHHVAAASGVGHVPRSNSTTRKRFRTKFTQDQKEKMLEFAEKVGWKMQKKDEDMINEFLNGIGVDKGVFKVWMHNNKNNNCSGKKDHQLIQISTPPKANNFAPPFLTANIGGTVKNTVLPGLSTTTTIGGSIGDNDDNHESNGRNIYNCQQEMRSSSSIHHIQNLSHEQQIPATNGGVDQDISTGTSGTGHGAGGTNGSNSSSS